MEQSYGEKIKYDANWKGPLEVTRRRTDPRALVVFLIYMVIWIAFGIHQMSLHRKSDSALNDGYRRISEDSIEKFDKDISIAVKCAVVSGFLAIAYILLLRFWPIFTVYTAITLYMTVFFASIIALIISVEEMDKSDTDRDLFKFFTIFAIILFIVFAILIVVFHKKIPIACRISQEAAKATMFFPSHFFLSISTLPLEIIVMTFWYLVHTKLSELYENGIYDQVVFKLLEIYNLSGIFWFVLFLSSILHMIFATSFSTWYWTMDKTDVPKDTVRRSMGIVIGYHLGTVAFGSGVSMLCEAFKLFAQEKRNVAQQGQVDADAASITCGTYCFQGLMQFIRYVSSTAYIKTALYGTDFLTSARDAFNLIMRNIAKVIITNQVTAVVFWLAGVIIILVPIFVGAAVMDDFDEAQVTIFMQAYFPLLLLWILPVFTILSAAIETIFVCVVEDYERNDGSQARPYYMSDKLRILMLSD